MKFDSFVTCFDNGFQFVRITDDVMDNEDWGIDEVVVTDGVVTAQRALSKGIYAIPDMVGWTAEQLMQWTHYDSPMGTHPQNFHEMTGDTPFLEDREEGVEYWPEDYEEGIDYVPKN